MPLTVRFAVSWPAKPGVPADILLYVNPLSELSCHCKLVAPEADVVNVAADCSGQNVIAVGEEFMVAEGCTKIVDVDEPSAFEQPLAPV